MNAVGIVAFSFGAPEFILPNRLIACIASQKARELGAPVYTQFDVFLGLGIEFKKINQKPGKPPPTLRIARGAVQWAKQRGFSDLWIVCAKPHLWRCKRDLTEAIREAGAQIKVYACEEIEQYLEDKWFCSDSTQARTRSRKEWQRRERILMLMPFFLYKRVAS